MLQTSPKASTKQTPAIAPLRVGLAGLGAVGLAVARRLDAGIPGLTLAAVSARDLEKARRNLPCMANGLRTCAPEALAEHCDVIVEGLPPAAFRPVALRAIEAGR